MDVTDSLLEKASYLAQLIHGAMTLLAIFIVYAVIIVCIVTVFIFVSIVATIVVFMPIAIIVLFFIIVSELVGYFWRIAPAGDGLVINVYAGVDVNRDDGGGQGPGASSNGRGDADNGRGWLRWWLGWWWCVALLSVAGYFLVTGPA